MRIMGCRGIRGRPFNQERSGMHGSVTARDDAGSRASPMTARLLPAEQNESRAREEEKSPEAEPLAGEPERKSPLGKIGNVRVQGACALARVWAGVRPSGFCPGVSAASNASRANALAFAAGAHLRLGVGV